VSGRTLLDESKFFLDIKDTVDVMPSENSDAFSGKVSRRMDVVRSTKYGLLVSK
jgi:hypothetical protein